MAEALTDPLDTPLPDLAPYNDLRRELFRRFFETGLTYEDYVRTGSDEQQARWRSFEKKIALNDSQTKLLGGFMRKMNILALSGVWCGDCMRQGPMLRAIEEASPTVTVRWQDNKANPGLAEELRINGAEKVPVIVVLSEDYFEVARFGDRHLSVYRRKAEQELGPACDAGILGPSEEALSEELAEWADFFERTQLILRLAPMLRRRYAD